MANKPKEVVDHRAHRNKPAEAAHHAFHHATDYGAETTTVTDPKKLQWAISIDLYHNGTILEGNTFGLEIPQQEDVKDRLVDLLHEVTHRLQRVAGSVRDVLLGDSPGTFILHPDLQRATLRCYNRRPLELMQHSTERVKRYLNGLE